MIAAARAEVVGLHEFFVGWFAGALDGSDEVFARFTDALHPDFSMIAPSGATPERDSVVESVRAAHSTSGAGFTIEIRNLVDRVVGADTALVTYEEWQFDGEDLLSCRISTACLVVEPAAPNGVQWRHLHETFRQG